MILSPAHLVPHAPELPGGSRASGRPSEHLGFRLVVFRYIVGGPAIPAKAFSDVRRTRRRAFRGGRRPIGIWCSVQLRFRGATLRCWTDGNVRELRPGRGGGHSRRGARTAGVGAPRWRSRVRTGVQKSCRKGSPRMMGAWGHLSLRIVALFARDRRASRSQPAPQLHKLDPLICYPETVP